jgi:hypothetical protein
VLALKEQCVSCACVCVCQCVEQQVCVHPIWLCLAQTATRVDKCTSSFMCALAPAVVVQFGVGGLRHVLAAITLFHWVRGLVLQL